MIRRSIVKGMPIYLKPSEIRKCTCIANFVLAQCILLFLIASTVLNCVWNPNLISFDPYKLASIMYLYDKKACEFSSPMINVVANLRLNTDTRGFNVYPIQWVPAIVTVNTRLSHKTRTYIELSVAIHVIWMLLTIAFKVIANSNKNPRLISFAVNVFFYTLIFTIIFDLSMAIVYVTHIKQSLTKGMIVRYSGWSVELQLANYNDFAGYLPMLASACWMRGIVILGLNIYSCKYISRIRSNMRAKDSMMTKLITTGHRPFPDAKNEEALESDTLYYRSGENRPYVRSFLGGFYNS